MTGGDARFGRKRPALGSPGRAPSFAACLGAVLGVAAAGSGCSPAPATVRLTIELAEGVPERVDTVEVTVTGAISEDNPDVVFFCWPCARRFEVGAGGDAPLVVEVERGHASYRTVWFRVVLWSGGTVVGWQYRPVAFPEEGTRPVTMLFETDCVPSPCTYPGSRHCLQGGCRDPEEPEPFTEDRFASHPCEPGCEGPDAGEVSDGRPETAGETTDDADDTPDPDVPEGDTPDVDTPDVDAREDDGDEGAADA